MATSTSKSSFRLPKSKTLSHSKLQSSSSSSLSSHLAMVELKSRVLSALAKLSDRDTHQIAVDDLEKIIRTLPVDGVPMLVHALIREPTDPAPIPQDAPGAKHPSFLVARRESLRLLALLCANHTGVASAHLPRIITHIVRRLKDPVSDSSVRDACRDAVGSLAALYVRSSFAAAAASDDGAQFCASGGGGGLSPVVGLFVKPLFEAMAEQNKLVQAGAAMCLAKVVECAGGGDGVRMEGKFLAGGVVLKRLCPRIFKMLSSQSFLAKGALLSVISSLIKVGAINPQGIPQLLQTIRECLESSDWTTRKAAADTLCILASSSSCLLVDGIVSTITVLEACRFDKVKPVRDSILEALQLWKNVKAEDGTGTSQHTKVNAAGDSGNQDLIDNKEKENKEWVNPSRHLESLKNSSAASSSDSDSVFKGNNTNIPEKAALLLKKRAPCLSDKELNLDFFQNIEKRSCDDLSVEVVLPRRFIQSPLSRSERERLSNSCSIGISSHDGAILQEPNNTNFQNEGKQPVTSNQLRHLDDFSREKCSQQRAFKEKHTKPIVHNGDDRTEVCQKDPSPVQQNVQTEATHISNRDNRLAIQRQLAQLERQQACILKMLQDFVGGSHNNMVTLENRVRSLERVVEHMAHGLAISSVRRGQNMMPGFEPAGRSSSKYSRLLDYSSSKFSRIDDVLLLFSEWFPSSDNEISSARGRESPWTPESEAWNPFGYATFRNGFMRSRRVFGAVRVDDKVSRTKHGTDFASRNRAFNKGPRSFKLGEGPSARSIWQSSKDEATLEAIRVAGEGNGTSRHAACTPISAAQSSAHCKPGLVKGPVWASWTHAMDLLRIGDIDSAYAEIMSTNDDLLLIKLMDKSGPVFDQISGEIAIEVLRAIGQFVNEQNLFDIALSWFEQLSDLVVENGADFLRIPLELKREILLNLQKSCGLELPQDWEGALPEELCRHLADAWDLNLQQHLK